jgi:molybdate transport system substrate-binding protein
MLRLFALLSLLIPAPLWAQDVTVFAAASLKNALEEITATWEHQTGYRATLSFAGSSALARQIEAGAPADIFISANQGWMDHLAARGLIQTESRVNLLGNQLVLIAPKGSAAFGPLGPESDLVARLGPDRMAIALTEAVPAGIYGKAALMHLGLWDQVSDRLAQTDNVRAALALVALGETPLGVTYTTDAQAQPKVQVLATFPDTSHPPILFPAALTTDAADHKTQEFLHFLQSKPARALFLEAGFLIPDPQ